MNIQEIFYIFREYIYINIYIYEDNKIDPIDFYAILRLCYGRQKFYYYATTYKF